MQVALSRNGVIYNLIEAQSVAAAQALFPDANAFEAVGVGIGWVQSGNEWVAPTPPEPTGPQARTPFLFAAGTITFENDQVTSITGNWNFKIAACFRADVGVYYVFFTEPLPDDDYMAKAWDGGKSCFITRDQQFTDFFVITVTDVAGDPSDASTISIEVIRAS